MSEITTNITINTKSITSVICSNGVVVSSGINPINKTVTSIYSPVTKLVESSELEQRVTDLETGVGELDYNFLTEINTYITF